MGQTIVAEALTEQMEEYLETIFRLELRGERARTGTIGKELGVTPQTVTDMIQKLQRSGTITYKPYYGVELSESGREIAQRQLEKHRVMQAFLQEFCNMEHEKAHEAACAMEHYIPDELDAWMANQLRERLGKPFDVDRRVRDQIE